MRLVPELRLQVESLARMIELIADPNPGTTRREYLAEQRVLAESKVHGEKDCAVCKEQFKLDTEDPDEQIIITLPCQHPFHEPCILPWLKNSGTCPVCRSV